jgi:hypothetical protein
MNLARKQGQDLGGLPRQAVQFLILDLELPRCVHRLNVNQLITV